MSPQPGDNTNQAKGSAKLFFSYAHEDEELRNRLAVHLSVLQKTGIIKGWSDREILPGEEWGGKIDTNLKDADIILLLISSDFIASEYCYETEMEEALKRHREGTAIVVPVILRPVDFAGTQFAELQALPRNAKPVTEWDDPDKAFKDITEGIRKLAKEFVRRRRNDESELVFRAPGSVNPRRRRRWPARALLLLAVLCVASYLGYNSRMMEEALSVRRLEDVSSQLKKLKSNLADLRGNGATKNQLLQQREEAAELRRQIQRYVYGLRDSQRSTWKGLLQDLYRFETVNSYLEIYEQAGEAKKVCDSKLWLPLNRGFQIGKEVSNCDNDALRTGSASILDGMVILLKTIDSETFSMTFDVSNDVNHVICTKDKTRCDGVPVNDEDRFGNPWQFVLQPEYVGWNDRNVQGVALSILERPEYKDGKHGPVDSSYPDDPIGDLITNASPGSGDCKPFFDDVATTLYAPSLTVSGKSVSPLGKTILQACGKIRGQITKDELNAIISDNGAIKDSLPDSLRGLAEQDLKDLFQRIWQAQNGLNHVFCGEWKRGTIGGLHYWGRYLQLQVNKSACLRKGIEVSPKGVYAVGVSSADGANEHEKKGYALGQNAIDILRIGNSSFLQCCESDQGRITWQENPDYGTLEKKFLTYYPYPNGDSSVANVVICKKYKNTDAQKAAGILTVYPDITPNTSLPVCLLE